MYKALASLKPFKRIFFTFLFIYSHLHKLFGPFLSSTPPPPPLSLPPPSQAEALISNFVEEKT
jgi:hypothetical protein